MEEPADVAALLNHIGLPRGLPQLCFSVLFCAGLCLLNRSL
jgi:hypothetical protein